jgi:hypothetical protein
MGDEYGIVIEKGDYSYDYKRIVDFFVEVVKDYNPIDYENIGKNLGVNPFDLFMFKTFIKKNGINHILELGSGTTSKFLDNLSIKRKSFALESIYHNDVIFDKINLYESYEIVQKYLKENKVDMVLIDCEHSKKMAEHIYNNFLKIINFEVPIFVHDWFDFGKKTYTEQIFYYNTLFNHYDLYLMSDLPENEIKTLIELNNYISKPSHVPRCSAILIPKTWKTI